MLYHGHKDVIKFHAPHAAVLDCLLYGNKMTWFEAEESIDHCQTSTWRSSTRSQTRYQTMRRTQAGRRRPLRPRHLRNPPKRRSRSMYTAHSLLPPAQASRSNPPLPPTMGVFPFALRGPGLYQELQCPLRRLGLTKNHLSNLDIARRCALILSEMSFCFAFFSFWSSLEEHSFTF